VGVGDDFGRGRQVEYVLGEWTNDENLVLQEILVKSSKAVESFCSIGLERAMNSMNS
jgi:PTH1 family peptidyl-tRNA hydrolase